MFFVDIYGKMFKVVSYITMKKNIYIELITNTKTKASLNCSSFQQHLIIVTMREMVSVV